MTMPDERFRAIRMAREFCYDLLDPKKTPKVPREVRKRAYWVVRHFPFDYEMRQIAALEQDILEIDSPEEAD